MKFGYDIGAWFYLTIRKNIFDNSDSKIKESSDWTRIGIEPESLKISVAQNVLTTMISKTWEAQIHSLQIDVELKYLYYQLIYLK